MAKHEHLGYDLGVFVVILTYVVDLAQIDDALADHAAWLDQQYAEGIFIASGRQVPRIGGVILTSDVPRADLERRLSLDPFQQRNLAEYTVVEFTPTRVTERLQQFLP
ncbi:MAG: YciI family protein [Pseudonocardiaceae bacterium]